MFSLAGIPPLAGFFAKFYVFLAAINAGLYVLAVIGVLAAVVGAYYYLRIIKIMYFDEPAAASSRWRRAAPRARPVGHLRPVLRPHRRPGRQGGREPRPRPSSRRMGFALAPTALPDGYPARGA